MLTAGCGADLRGIRCYFPLRPRVECSTGWTLACSLLSLHSAVQQYALSSETNELMIWLY